jgi:hypothetical protein
MSASARLAAAFAVAAPLLLSALPASAADLGGSPYDDPRYGDAYTPGYASPPRDFEPAGPPPVRYTDRDDADDFGGPPDRWEPIDGCVPRRVIRARLLSDGWNDFDNLEPHGKVVLVTARSPAGRPFDLTIDRCTGDIVDARPIAGRRDYAYGPRRAWHSRY